MPNIIPTIVALLVTLTLPSAAFAKETYNFTYNTENLPPEGYGYSNPDTYHAAIRVDHPLLTGAIVTGVDFNIPESDAIIDPNTSAWVALQLPADPDDNSSFITTESTIINGNHVSISFPSPVEIPENGLYVGYTLTVTQTGSSPRKSPIATVFGEEPGALFLYARSRGKWIDIAGVSGRMADMKVTVEADIPTQSLNAEIKGTPMVPRNQESSFPLNIFNLTPHPVSSLSLSVECDNRTETHSITLDSPLPDIFNATRSIQVPFNSPDLLGNTPVKVTVLEINGSPIASPHPDIQGELRLVPMIPVNRPLVEEYTGLWCGSCPAGYVALEQGAYYHPDRFIAIAYHDNDPLQSAVARPSRPNGLPAMYINREKIGGPDVTLEKWTEEASLQTPVDISLTMEWTDDSRSALVVTANTTFLQNYNDADYGISFTLVADNLSNPSWGQANYFAGQSRSGLFWDTFTNAGAYVYGLRYDNIPLLATDFRGSLHTFPEKIEEFKTYTHSATFPLSDVPPALLTSLDHLRIVATVVDRRTQLTINANTTEESRLAPISQSAPGITGDRPITKTEYIDLQGTRHATPPDAPHIRLDHHPTGTPTITKSLPPTP